MEYIRDFKLVTYRDLERFKISDSIKCVAYTFINPNYKISDHFLYLIFNCTRKTINQDQYFIKLDEVEDLINCQSRQ